MGQGAYLISVHPHTLLMHQPYTLGKRTCHRSKVYHWHAIFAYFLSYSPSTGHTHRKIHVSLRSYCDAQCPRDIKFINGEANAEGWAPSPSDPNAGSGQYGTCCTEMDIWEANSQATQLTPHACKEPAGSQYRCDNNKDCGDIESGHRYDGLCDKDGGDWNPYRLGDEAFFGAGEDFSVNTNSPFTVVTQFLTTDGTDDGDLNEIRRFYIQVYQTIHKYCVCVLETHVLHLFFEI